jgi:hypothetical protein
VGRGGEGDRTAQGGRGGPTWDGQLGPPDIHRNGEELEDSRFIGTPSTETCLVL